MQIKCKIICPLSIFFHLRNYPLVTLEENVSKIIREKIKKRERKINYTR